MDSRGGLSLSNITNNLEAIVKSEITQLHKIHFGKGPVKTTVKIFDNIVFVRFDDGLTQVEQSLMDTAEGEELVRKIRDEMIMKRTPLYVPRVEELVKEKLDGVCYMLDKKNKAVLMFLAFENEIVLY